jgi:hypothetical protein
MAIAATTQRRAKTCLENFTGNGKIFAEVRMQNPQFKN